ASDWNRKTDIQLIDGGLLPMPKGYVREGEDLRPMTHDERVIAALDAPPSGFKVEKGKIVAMTVPEKIEAGQLGQEEYEQCLAAENECELQHRLADLQTPKAMAQAEIDEKYAAVRKAKLAALLEVEQQDGWPLEVSWPEET
ncbi:MAG: hypothetical protein LBI06_02640, partial [Treponema sp.]|nr:hypothetical protein [Treponema sp.]